MKLQSAKLFLISCLSIMFACTGGDSPKAVADQYLKAIGQYDFEGAKKYGTEDTGKLLDVMSGFAKMAPDSTKNDVSFVILDEKIDGEKAIVIYKEEGKEAETTLNLLRIEGKWKVNMTKESMNDSETGTMDIGATQTDTTSQGAK